MDKELLDRCKKVGRIVAHRAIDKKSEGPIYDFRNAKTLEQFVEALERFHTREQGIVPDDDLEFLLRELDLSSWRRIKSLCTLYAANTYLRVGFRQEQIAKGEKPK